MKFYDLYYEIKKIKPRGLRGDLRDLALDGFSVIDKIKGIKKELQKPRIQFLYIHHIFKDEEAKLENLLLRLSKHHTFISYSEAIEKIIKKEIDKPYIVFSSDDGFKNNIIAAEILNKYNAKACFFINPNIIGESNFEKIRNHCKNRLNFPPIEFLNWDEVNYIQKIGHEIGSHTLDHINVAKTDLKIFEEDCVESLKILEKYSGKKIHFAFPYGRFFHFNDEARKIIFKVGFESCATAERGCHINHDTPLSKDQLCILRDHVILDWNLDHVLYFLAKNSRKASIQNNLYPY